MFISSFDHELDHPSSPLIQSLMTTARPLQGHSIRTDASKTLRIINSSMRLLTFLLICSSLVTVLLGYILYYRSSRDIGRGMWNFGKGFLRFEVFVLLTLKR